MAKRILRHDGVYLEQLENYTPTLGYTAYILEHEDSAHLLMCSGLLVVQELTREEWNTLMRQEPRS